MQRLEEACCRFDPGGDGAAGRRLHVLVESVFLQMMMPE
jgi:hypothetical protein